MTSPRCRDCDAGCSITARECPSCGADYPTLPTSWVPVDEVPARSMDLSVFHRYYDRETAVDAAIN